jgi:hypothetical protein
VKRDWLVGHMEQSQIAWAANVQRFEERERRDLSFELARAQRARVLEDNKRYR